MADALRRFRELLSGDKVVVAPGAFDCIDARLIERAGFPVVYMSGFGAAASDVGVPDIGLVSLGEMVTHARHMVVAVEAPVLADADTGYGNALSVMRTVREYEAAGLAGCHIEDQITPWHFRPLSERDIVSREEFAGKIRAAVAARRNPDFVIVARSDARSAVGLDEAIERCKIAVEAGADLTWVDGPESTEELVEIANRVPGMRATTASGSKGNTGHLRFEELQTLGFRLLIIPVAVHLAAIAGVKAALETLNREGYLAPMADRLASSQEVLELLGLRSYQAAEKEFVPDSTGR